MCSKVAININHCYRSAQRVAVSVTPPRIGSTSLLSFIEDNKLGAAASPIEVIAKTSFEIILSAGPHTHSEVSVFE